MATVNLPMPNLIPEGIAVDRFNLKNETVPTASASAEVITGFISVELPTECWHAFGKRQGLQVYPYFRRPWKGNVIFLKKYRYVFSQYTPIS
jgi:hypothetical protein